MFFCCINNLQGEFSYALHIVSSSDADFYPQLLNMMGSIYSTNPRREKKFLIIDLGLTPEQRIFLSGLPNVICKEVEKTNSEILVKQLVRPPNKFARGWYSWKPVAFKMGFDHFDYFLYIDAGITIAQSLDPIFEQILNNGYFFIEGIWNSDINKMSTLFVKRFFIHKFKDTRFIFQRGILGGIQGLHKRVCSQYVQECYEHSKNIRLFMDDGTAPEGFGHGRHDQTIFSMYVIKNNWKKLKFNDNHTFLYSRENTQQEYLTLIQHIYNESSLSKGD